MNIKATAFEWDGQSLRLLDQRRLPFEEVWIECRHATEVAEAIRSMVTRGAPLIGITAAFGMVLAGLRAIEQGGDLRASLTEAAEVLTAARPTAVNLSWAVRRMLHLMRGRTGDDAESLIRLLEQEAVTIYQEDVEGKPAYRSIRADLLPDRARVLTHCNTGALAVSELGTALGIIRTAYADGKLQHVWVDETRPFLQGSRLTAWELQKSGIPFSIVVDGAAAWLMKQRTVDAVIVGADRIAGNGDTANKIGTYMLAACAARHGIPFFIAAPTSTIDPSLADGSAIPIEERPEDEVLCWREVRVAPQGAHARNPAFDVTPAELITAIITERGVLRPPYNESIAGVLKADSP